MANIEPVQITICYELETIGPLLFAEEYWPLKRNKQCNCLGELMNHDLAT